MLMSKSAAIVGGVLLAGGGIAAAYLLTKKPGSGIASMCFVTSAGCTTTPTYAPGQTMQGNVTVPSSYSPVSVQAFVSGNPGSVHPWSVAATGFTYGIDFGPADFPAGTYPVYAVVTFADGSTATTNAVPVVLSSTAPTPCTSNSDCNCQTCYNGECTDVVPANILVTKFYTGSQDETVASVGVPFTNLAVCDWATVRYSLSNGAVTSIPNQFSFQVRLVDALGNGIPCATLTAKSTSSAISVYLQEVTDVDGYATFYYQLASPQGGSCPAPGSTTTNPILFTINVSYGGLTVAVPLSVDVYITGI